MECCLLQPTVVAGPLRVTYWDNTFNNCILVDKAEQFLPCGYIIIWSIGLIIIGFESKE